ncbi:hypothetical protein PQO03_02735 [Lentisphaera profundi]|uniref:Uncharacterized protein n=1 Tax=Lentisphaera profundi TaxID=1658616 RepID=A0ABY7VRQ1_9BACT|nr:hypothetical protein [Lentisphaera profundi]WDE96876.1 hypothetical protein PQO03_02735 [Lentisphaera profundi]
MKTIAIIFVLSLSVSAGIREWSVKDLNSNHSNITTALIVEVLDFKIDNYILNEKVIPQKLAYKYYRDLDYSDYVAPKGNTDSIPMIYMNMTIKMKIMTPLISSDKTPQVLEYKFNDLMDSMCPHYLTIMGQKKINGILISSQSLSSKKLDFTGLEMSNLKVLKAVLKKQKQ